MATAPPPARDDQRIILHFDYDCFYASVFESADPILKTLPLAVQQKQIVVTCNYEARRRGLHKLQLVKDAKLICPDVVIVLGEDLTRFRDASKELYLFLKGFVDGAGWGEVTRVERLGFDEVFMDVTDLVGWNVENFILNEDGDGGGGGLGEAWFCLDRRDPVKGFGFDANVVCGNVYPDHAQAGSASEKNDSQLRRRLLLASQLAGYLRSQLEEQKGYTATAGISTSKLLAKVVGSTHKPNSQTTLLPPYDSTGGSESNVLNFLDSHEIRAIPGIGSKLSRKLTSYIAAKDHSKAEEKVAVRDVRLFPGMGPPVLEKILGGPGAPRDIGVKIWGFLHGVDNTPVGEARDTPTQISIENSYGHLDTFEAVRKELLSLAVNLIRRMKTDLTESSSNGAGKGTQWVARPRTLRLSTVQRPTPGSDNTQRGSSRISHSAPLPQFVFNLDDSVDALAERLVRESAISMFRKLHRERTGWNLRVLNLAVTNMAEVAGDAKHNSGRDISKMFQRREEHRDTPPISGPMELQSSGEHLSQAVSLPAARGDGSWESDGDSDGEEESMPCVPCTICGAMIPHFALVAHEVYHSTER